MKLLIAFLLFSVYLAGCSEDENRNSAATDAEDKIAVNVANNPEGLARECCNCWNKVKTTVNQTGKARKADECSALTMHNLSLLQEMGVEKDWNRQQVEAARNAFDVKYSKCK